MELDDILMGIFRRVDSGSMYKACRGVCVRWNALVDAVHPNGDTKWANHLLTLVNMFPGAKWNWSRLAENPTISYEQTLALPKHRWDYEGCVISMSKFTHEYILDLIRGGLPVDWAALSTNPNTTWEIVSANIYQPWDFVALSTNPAITWEIMMDNAHFPSGELIPWGFEAFACNPHVTWKIVQDNPWVDWDYSSFKLSPGFPFAVIRANQHLDWYYPPMSASPLVTHELVLANPDFPWNPDWLHRNPNITWEIVQQGHVFHTTQSQVEQSFMLSLMKFVEVNPNITYEQVCAWTYQRGSFSDKPNLTWKIVAENQDVRWDYSLISANVFGKN